MAKILPDTTTLTHHDYSAEPHDAFFHDIRELSQSSHLTPQEAAATFAPAREHAITPTLEHALTNSGISMGQYKRDVTGTLQKLHESKRVLLPTRFDDIADAIANVQADQLVVIPEEAVHHTPHKYLKKSRLLRVEHTEGQGIEHAIAHAIRGVTKHDLIAGYSFRASEEQTLQVVHLESIIRGRILFEAVTANLKISPTYHGNQPLKTGIIATVGTIPSFASDDTYHATFSHVPVHPPGHPEQAADDGFGVRVMSNVPRDSWQQVKFGRHDGTDQHEQTWTPYVVYAYEHLARELEQQHLHVLRPYLPPKVETMQTALKIWNHVLIQKHDQGRKSAYRLARPGVAQTEELLWLYVSRKNEQLNEKRPPGAPTPAS